MLTFIADCRYALRQFRKNPGFTAVAILTLALGIGATTGIFSVVYGVLLRPLPYPEAHRLAAVFELTTRGRPARLADPNFDDFRDQNRSFEALAKYRDGIASVSGGSEPIRTRVAYVSADFLGVFRVQPVLGRGLAEADAHQAAAPAVLVSDGYWRQQLASTRDLSRASLKIDGSAFAVIGVMPPGFQFPADVSLWLAADRDGKNLSRTSHNYRAVGRLREGVTVEQASRDISAIARRIHDASSEKGDYLLKDGMAVGLQESITGRSRSTLLLLLGAVGFLLFVACANVANMMLAQAAVRGRELAVRSALGAGRARLVRQFLTESFLLALAGGGVGVLAAVAGVGGLVSLAPDNIPRLDSVSVSIPVLLFAILLSTAIAAGLGASTAIRATSGNLRGALMEGGRGQAGSHGSQRLGRAIVSAQIAITLVLLIGAGLFARSLMRVLDVNPGFRTDGVITMDVSLPWLTDPAAKSAQAAFFSTLIGRLGGIPGVRAVGAVTAVPMDGGLPDGMFVVASPAEAPSTAADLDALFRQKARLGTADFAVATDGYFAVLGIPLIRGRMFDGRDTATAPHAAVISESLGRERWPGQDPIGRTIEFGNMDGDLRLLTIVGIVGDVRQYGAEAPPRPTVYVNLFQRPRPEVSLTLLSDADPGGVTAAARGIVRTLNPELPVRFRLLSGVHAASVASRRFNVMVIGFFGATALLLASAGVFGVMAYSVSRRTREIGVRIALGAASGDALRLVLGQGLRTIGIGVAIGITGALILTRALEAMLFGVTATDPATFGGVTLLLAGIAMLACYVPARRATRVDPMVALRSE